MISKYPLPSDKVIFTMLTLLKSVLFVDKSNILVKLNVTDARIFVEFEIDIIPRKVCEISKNHKISSALPYGMVNKVGVG